MHRRQEKDERKEVALERRVETIEKEMAKHRPETYNFLVGYIRQQGTHLQQINRVAMEMQDFLNEKGLMTEYQQWLEAKYPKVETTEGAICPSCGGRGYIGDKEECPLCHPNKTWTEPPEEKKE